MTIYYICNKCGKKEDSLGINIFQSSSYDFCLCDICLNKLKEYIEMEEKEK